MSKYWDVERKIKWCKGPTKNPQMVVSAHDLNPKSSCKEMFGLGFQNYVMH